MTRCTDSRRRGASRLAFALLVLAAAPAAADEPGDTRSIPVPGMLPETPLYGAGYDRYEPTFYTGFAPRVHDPRRVHLHVGRGNQLRVTAVLSDDDVRDYARDLLARYETYRTLIGDGRLVLTQNLGFEAFEQTLQEVGLAQRVAEASGLAPEEQRERGVALLERLNPDRIHRISFPESELVRRWAARIRPQDRQKMDERRQLDLLNAMLPTRFWLAEVPPGVSPKLRALVAKAPAEASFAEDFLRLFDEVSGGVHPRRDGAVSFVEFTAIYPIGSLNEYTDFHGRRIPLYPTPGRRALTTHQRTKTVDHIPTKVIYSYSPWIPYMHVGKTLHNSFHTLWWRMVPEETPFLSGDWLAVDEGSRSGKPFHYYWLLSRGPMSHGCTHLGTGHIGELRQVLPSETERLYEVDVFLNKSYLYDVFDVDGDFEPEVMGVAYYIAYSLEKKRPSRLRAPSERRAFYDWLYGGEIRYDADGRARVPAPVDGRFVGRTAVNGEAYPSLSLREAAYEPERFQFYELVDIPFARELRKVSLRHPFRGVSLAGAAGG